MENTLLHTEEELELFAKNLEVLQHSAWYGAIDEEAASLFLQDKPSMSYLLRQGSEGEYHYWLSHKKSDGEIHHRHFTIRMFPDGLFFANWRAPAAEELVTFIQGALACTE